MTSNSSTVDYQSQWKSVMMDNYGTPNLTLVRGAGAKVWDNVGKEYLDLVSGIAVNSLGHTHPAIVRAVTEQISTLGHTSNLYAHPVGLELAERLLAVAGLSNNGKVLFVNSGAEANEAALKLSRLTGRSKIVACKGAFHGRTMGALTLTGQPAKRDPFLPLVPDVVHVPFGDVAALQAVVDDTTAAVFLEPILGEGGVIPTTDDYLKAAREITQQAGALLVLDEVQTGIARTGNWFAFQHAGIVPDVITLAKGLGGGLPLGAVIGVGTAGDLLRPGQHGTTFGGNPVCCAAGLAVVNTITEENLIDQVSLRGKEFIAGIERLAHPLISEVRGRGLLLGIVLTEPRAQEIAQTALQAGYLINPVASNVLRLAPPLILRSQQVQDFLTDFPAILNSVGG